MCVRACVPVFFFAFIEIFYKVHATGTDNEPAQQDNLCSTLVGDMLSLLV